MKFRSASSQEKKMYTIIDMLTSTRVKYVKNEIEWQTNKHTQTSI